MKTSTPIRIDAELYTAATGVAPLMSRSTAQQIVHWARHAVTLESRRPRAQMRGQIEARFPPSGARQRHTRPGLRPLAPADRIELTRES